MVDSTQAIQRDFASASQYINVIAQKTAAAAPEHEATLLQSIGDGQLYWIPGDNREKEAVAFAKEILAIARRAKRDYPTRMIKVATAPGSLVESTMGLTGPVLWNIHTTMKRTPRSTLRLINVKSKQLEETYV